MGRNMKAQRVHIRGVSASGKSTLGGRLSRALDCDYIELDSLWHRENWTTAPIEEFRALVSQRVSGNSWVVEGNYKRVRDVIWDRVELVIWLDYPLPLVLWRLTRRTFGRAFRREVLWAGNRERLWRHLLIPKDSLYWWVLTTYRRLRREFREVSSDPAFAHVQFIRFAHPRETEAWVRALESEVQKL
jgi:adenylate kinase family enzyme